MKINTQILKKKLKQALASTYKVISDDIEIKKDLKKNKSSHQFNFFEIDNLNSKYDFIKARAETDNNALKKNSQMTQFIKKTYLPTLHVSHFIL